MPADAQQEPYPPDEIAIVLLQTVEERRSAVDQMMWQVPALSLTAQSFLLSIALASSATASARVISSCLALIAALAAIQLLLKHRFHELQLSRWLERLSNIYDWPNVHAPADAEMFAWADTPRHPWLHDARSPVLRIRRWLVRLRSVYIWALAILCFALADAGLAIAGAISLLT